MSNETVSQAEQVRRRSQRLMLRIPIEVAGKGPDGVPFREKAYTLNVNRHGAAITLVTPVRVNTVLTITNLTSSISAPFTVVNRVEKSTTGVPEWGVESLGLDANFWGISFPDDSPNAAAGESVEVILECQRCHSRLAGRIPAEQFKSLSGQPLHKRSCAKCAGTTDWTLSLSRSDSREATVSRPGGPPSPAAAGLDQRRSNRVNIKLPVRVRLEDVGETENISKTGVCFTTTLEMMIGDRVRLTVGYSPGSDAKEVSARIVWKKRAAGEKRAFYGAELLEND
ncbi:MAG: PilZ domain-containing protein [Terriglobia bacterium]